MHPLLLQTQHGSGWSSIELLCFTVALYICSLGGGKNMSTSVNQPGLDSTGEMSSFPCSCLAWGLITEDLELAENRNLLPAGKM